MAACSSITSWLNSCRRKVQYSTNGVTSDSATAPDAQRLRRCGNGRRAARGGIENGGILSVTYIVALIRKRKYQQRMLAWRRRMAGAKGGLQRVAYVGINVFMAYDNVFCMSCVGGIKRSMAAIMAWRRNDLRRHRHVRHKIKAYQSLA